MIEIAEEIKGWPRLVYDFGNRFIHLSGFHLYKLEEPISKIEGRELELIIRYLEEKHDFHNYGKLTFQHLLDYLPDVMQKIIENNLEELEILKVTI